jgi:hypothetical protein
MLNNNLFQGHESQQFEKGRGKDGNFSMYWRCKCIFYREIVIVKVMLGFGTGKDRRSTFENIGVVKAFGLPNPRCPGRSLAFTLAMSVLVRLLLTFELVSVGGKKFRVPKSNNGLSLGPAQVDSNPRIFMQQRNVLGQWLYATRILFRASKNVAL